MHRHPLHRGLKIIGGWSAYLIAFAIVLASGIAWVVLERSHLGPDAGTMLPDPPAPVTKLGKYPFGDRIAAADEQLAGAVDHLLRPRYGQPVETHMAAPDDLDVIALQRSYVERADGWQPMPEVVQLARGKGGRGFGFFRGKTAFVVLIPQSDGTGLRPITVQRYGN